MNSTAIEQKTTHLTLDPDETRVEFAVKTLWGLMTVHGHFDRVDGSYDLGSTSDSIELTIDADSLDPGHVTRDKHLRSDDFFRVTSHPRVRFTSTRVHHVTAGILHVAGNLEAAGKVVPLEFAATMRPVGDELEVEATTAVDPRELGMSTGKLGMIRAPATLHVKARLAAAGEHGE